MDRGIKIAILIACVVSLGLGLLWDNIIDATRATLAPSADPTGMAPDRYSATVGDTRLPAPVVQAPPAPAAPDAAQPPRAGQGVGTSPAAPSVPEGDTYTIRANDSWWKIAHVHYKKLGKSTEEWQAANPTVKDLKVGARVVVPR